MTQRPHTFDSPTASGDAPEMAPRLLILAVSGSLAIAGTSSSAPTRVWEAPFVRGPDSTASGLTSSRQQLPRQRPEDRSESTRRAVTELRRVSGLTWEQLGRLLVVSRRAVHFWASGRPLNAANEQRLLRVLDVIRAADRGDAHSNRAALFGVHDNRTPFELLVAQRFDEARALLAPAHAPTPARPKPTLSELSPAAKAARQPLPPEELVDARHEPIHTDVGRGRAAKTARTKKRDH